MADTHVASPGQHSGRLKYADPQDLPSFPSSGLRKDGAAAGAAASLGWANQKSFSHWQPDRSDSASAAALLAKDYKMAPQWQPDSSSAGAKAALLAHASASGRQLRDVNDGVSDQAPASRPRRHESWGNSAAAMAAASRKRQNSATASTHQHSSSSQASFGNTAATSAFKRSQSLRQSQSVRRPAQTPVQPPANGSTLTRNGPGSLSAAKSAMPVNTNANANRRPRSVSTPTMKESYPDEARAATNALSAATAAHRPSKQTKSFAGKGGSVPYTAMSRDMFTSHPTIGPEADEQKKADLLHASAVAMAKKMYSHQQQMADQAKDTNHPGMGDDGSSVEDNAPRPYVNLQEAAYKLAQERLSKLEDEHQQNRNFQEYYGGRGTTASSPGRRNTLHRRFTVRGHTLLRRRSSSEGDMLPPGDDDRKRSEKIRKQMSIFSSNLSRVDEQKRTKDREAVLAAAQRNVRQRLQGMDEKVYAETGRHPPPRRLSEWELKAHEAAQAMYDSRQDENQGKVDMGGGMFMHPQDVDAIAARKVQPLLDEINEKAAEERERQETARLEAEAKKRDEEREREREREIKEMNKKIREQDRNEERERKHHEKEEQKAKRDAEKAARADERRLAKEEKRKSKTGAAAGGAARDEDSDSDENEPEPVSHAHPRPASSGTQPGESPDHHHQQQTEQEPPRSPNSLASPASPASPTGRVKSWFKTHFHRPRGKSSAAEEKDKDSQNSMDRGFLGGAALSGRVNNDSSLSVDDRAESMREVAMAGKGQGKGKQNEDGPGDARPSSSSSEEAFVTPSAGNSKVRQDVAGSSTITPPPKLRDPNWPRPGSPSRDSRFRENLE